MLLQRVPMPLSRAISTVSLGTKIMAAKALLADYKVQAETLVRVSQGMYISSPFTFHLSYLSVDTNKQTNN